MLALTLAALSLLPSQPGGLTLTNKRMTYGPLGQERKDSKFVVGDVLCLAFDIEGLKTLEDGKVKYSVGMKVVDAVGKLQFEQEPSDAEAINSLGGSRMVANSIVDIRLDTKPGKYTVMVVVNDREGMTKASLTHEFEVLPPRLALVRTQLTYPMPGQPQPAPPVAVVGQTYLINFAVTGMKLDAKGQPNVAVDMRVVDEKTNEPTLKMNPSGKVAQVAEEFKMILPFQFPIHLNRPGRFRLEIKITDLNDNKKTTEQTLEFTVLDQK